VISSKKSHSGSAEDEFEDLAEIAGDEISPSRKPCAGRPSEDIVGGVVLDVTHRSEIDECAMDGGAAHRVADRIEQLVECQWLGHEGAKYQDAGWRREKLLKQPHPVGGVLHQIVVASHAYNSGFN
jgi:hypothetical protein